MDSACLLYTYLGDPARAGADLDKALPRATMAAPLAYDEARKSGRFHACYIFAGMKLIYLLALPLLAFTADNWQPFSLDKQVSVRLPTKPFEMTKEEVGDLPAGAHVFAAQSGNEAYQLTGPLPVPAALKPQDTKARDLFYEGMLKGLVQDQGNTLLARSTFSTVAGEGVAVTYQSPATADTKEMTLFSRVFIVNRSSYALTYLRADGDTSSGNRRRFFNSITVKP
jgi:hypothetical protein